MRGKAVVVNDIDEARTVAAAARAAGRPVTFLSAPAAAAAVGPGFYAALLTAVRSEFPDVEISAILDCDYAAGRAMAAVQSGFEGVVYTGSEAVCNKLADIGEQYGCTVYDHRPDALTLEGRRDADAAVRAWLEN